MRKVDVQPQSRRSSEGGRTINALRFLAAATLAGGCAAQQTEVQTLPPSEAKACAAALPVNDSSLIDCYQKAIYEEYHRDTNEGIEQQRQILSRITDPAFMDRMLNGYFHGGWGEVEEEFVERRLSMLSDEDLQTVFLSPDTDSMYKYFILKSGRVSEETKLKAALRFCSGQNDGFSADDINEMTVGMNIEGLNQQDATSLFLNDHVHIDTRLRILKADLIDEQGKHQAMHRTRYIRFALEVAKTVDMVTAQDLMHVPRYGGRDHYVKYLAGIAPQKELVAYVKTAEAPVNYRKIAAKKLQSDEDRFEVAAYVDNEELRRDIIMDMNDVPLINKLARLMLARLVAAGGSEDESRISYYRKFLEEDGESHVLVTE